MKRILIAALFSAFLGTYALAETIVFEGTPMTKNSSNIEESTNEPVTGEDQIIYKLVITKDGNEYIWFSREKKKLLYTKSGEFHYFVNPDGSGYIKIAKTEAGKYFYMEQMSIGLSTITYWGTSDKFLP